MATEVSQKLIDRRTLVKAAGAGFLTSLTPVQALALENADAVFASAYRGTDGGYGIATLTEAGEIVHTYQLPARGHDVVWHPGGRTLVAFARRPGSFAAAIDLTSHIEPLVFNAPANRHFYGHGCFSADGRLLFATENDFANARGCIGIYDATNAYQRIGEFDSGGVGPHDVLLSADGRTLIVANGGIETHPDYPRAKLNLATMQPNLSLIDISSGELSGRWQLPADMHRLSMRHLAMQDSGTIWFACQNEGDATDTVALAGALLEDGQIRMIDIPPESWASMRGYVGSVAFNDRSNRVAISSPRGGVTLEIDAATNCVERKIELADVCGLASRGLGFAHSSGLGVFGQSTHDVSWDNHIQQR